MNDRHTVPGYRPVMAILVYCALVLLPVKASALAKHNLYPDLINCDTCHVMAEQLVEDNTSYLRAGARSIPTMKALNGNRVPSSKSPSGPKSVGCTYCHYNTGRTTYMKDVLDQFNGRLSQHPLDRGYTLDNAAGARKLTLSANTNTTRWMSNWDNSWTEPSDQVGCTDCHDVANPASTTLNAGGYPDHADPDNASLGRAANPVMLRGGAASWSGGHASNAFCVSICHNGLPSGTAGWRMGHYGWGAFDNAGAPGTLKESAGAALRTSRCVDCHETHYSGSQRNLFGELGETGRLLPSQSTTAIAPANCTSVCHNDGTCVAVGHGRPNATSGAAMGVACIQCHDASVAHRTPANPKRLFREDAGKATLAENVAGNGLDDDYDGVADNPGEASLRRSGESNCTNGSCHADRHLHAGSGKINGTPGSASCLHCHDMHGNGVDNNIRMVKSTIMGKSVRYYAKTDYVRTDNGGTVASLCDNPSCHAKRLGSVSTPGTILGDVPEHVQANVGPGYDCSGCHSHASASGGGSFLPTCNSCHSYPGQPYVPGTHALSPVHAKHADPATGYGYACSLCHYRYLHNTSGVADASQWTTKFNGANVKIRFDGSVNPPNAFGPAYNGVAADNASAGSPGLGTWSTPGNGACQGLWCHANSATARSWSGYSGAPTWNDAPSGGCGTCHKTTRNDPPTSGAHRKHVDNTTIGYGIGCNACHYATTADGLTITDRTAHVSASAPATTRVAWNPGDNAVRYGGTYSFASKSCTNIYCHSPGTRVNQATFDNGAFGWPTWTQTGSIGCDHCHGDGSRPDGMPAYPSGSPKANSHSKHVAAGDGCQMCHGATTTDGLTIANRANHVNGIMTVVPDNAAHNFTIPYVSPNCSAIACHGGNGAQWGGAPPKCGDCHLGAGDTNQYQTANAAWYAAGVAASIDNAEWFYSGHGRPAPSGNYDASGHPAADLGSKAGTGDPCRYCHDAAVPHRTATNPFRLVVQTGTPGYGSAGWNATCLVCHSRSTTPPGFQPTGGAPYAVVTGSAGDRVDAAHFGTKHAGTDNSAAGYFCWDCHDPHGNRSGPSTGNIYMMQRAVLPKNDGVYGARVGAITGEAPVPLTFANDNTVATGGDWARTDFRGLCQVCHHGNGAGSPTQAKYYTQSSDNTTHNATLACLSCHSHDKNLAASCSACHGDSANRIWPQKAGFGPAARTNVAADYNYDGRHLLHLTEIATRAGGYNLADNSQWSSSQQLALCLYCHDYAADAAHATAGPRAVVFPATGARMMGGATDNGSPAFAASDNSCANVQCHNRKNTTAAWNWYAAPAKRCDMCHTAGGTLDNNPRTGLHAVTAAGVTRHDNTLGAGGCRECHWQAAWPPQSTTQRHIDGNVDNSAPTLTRANMAFAESAAANRSGCQGAGLDNALGCHSDRGAWKRLWSTEADNTTTVAGSPRCNVCHGQWKSVAGSAGWRDNTAHFNAGGANIDNNTVGQGHDGVATCDGCHAYASVAGKHLNRLATVNGNGDGYARVGNYAGCTACHGGATDNAHRLPISVFAAETVTGLPIPMPSCDLCHAVGASNPSAPKVFDKAGTNSGWPTLPGVPRSTGFGSHLAATKTDNITVSTDWNVQCNKCHNGHSGNVVVPLPPTSWNNNNGFPALDMRTVLGIPYAATGGIRLGGTATSGATEAEVCWNCHALPANNVSEFGYNTSTAPAGYPVAWSNFPTTHDGTSRRFNFGWIYTDNTGTTKTTDWTAGWWVDEYDPKLKRRIASVHTASLEAAGQSSSVAANVDNGGIVRRSSPTLEDKSYIRCSYCHDVHDLNLANGSGFGAAYAQDSMVGKPWLRGSWTTNPYPPELPPRAAYGYSTAVNVVAGINTPRALSTAQDRGGYFIDQNSGRPTDNALMNTLSATAGLCVLCHGTSVDTMKYYTGYSLWRAGMVNGHSNAVVGGTGANKRSLFNASRYGLGMGVQGGVPYEIYAGCGSGGGSCDGNYPLYSLMTYYCTSGGCAILVNSGWFGGPVGTFSQGGGDYANWYGGTLLGSYTGVAGGKGHNFTCSKCHSPHATGLPALLTHNCIDPALSDWTINGYTGTNLMANNCHRKTTTTDGWHRLAPGQ